MKTPKTWQHGTLVYTLGGLISLFFLLLVGDVAWSLKERAVTPIAQIVLRKFEASDFLIAILVGSFPAALGLLIGPVVAAKSDLHRSPRGRRIPFLLVPTPFVVLGLVGMAYSESIAATLFSIIGLKQVISVSLNLLVFSFFWTVFEIASVTVNSIFYGLIADVVPSKVAGRFYGMFRAVSLFVGIVFTGKVLGHVESHYGSILSLVGVIYGLGFGLMCLKVKEGEAHNTTEDRKNDGLRSLMVSYYGIYRSGFYLSLFMVVVLGTLSFVPLNTFGLFYSQKLGLGVNGYGQALAVTFGVSLVLSLPIGWLADRYHPLRVGAVIIAIYAVLMLASSAMVQNSEQLRLGLIAHGVVSGAFWTATASLGQYLFPAKDFARFYAAMQVLAAFGYMALPPTLGAVFDGNGRDYRVSFLVAAALSLLSLIACLISLKNIGQVTRVHGCYVPPDICPK